MSPRRGVEFARPARPRYDDLVPNLQWLLLDFTDPRFDLTREQKREIQQRVKRIRFFDRPMFIVDQPMTEEKKRAMIRRRSAWRRVVDRLPLGVVYLLWLLFVLLPWQFVGQPWWVIFGVLSTVALILWVVTCGIGYVLFRPWYRYAMYELGYEICAECGYPLHGLDGSTRCPECGWRKTHRDDPPPVEWTDADRRTLRKHGYEPCNVCGGLLMTRDQKCPRCGEPHAAATNT
jgi:predicted RNA-binding Zn-ribbon protein involved in translation (DUF1610 family)